MGKVIANYYSVDSTPLAGDTSYNDDDDYWVTTIMF